MAKKVRKQVSLNSRLVVQQDLVALGGTGAHAIAQAAQLHRRARVIPNKRREMNRKACRVRVQW